MASEDNFRYVVKDEKVHNTRNVERVTSTESSTGKLSSNSSDLSVDKSGQFSLIEQHDIYQCIFSLTTDTYDELTPYTSPDVSNTLMPPTLIAPASDSATPVSIESSCKEHVNNILYQLLYRAGLSSSWCHVIQPLIMEAGYRVKPDVFKGDTMDVCDYVKIKKIPGGCKENSSLIYGVVCSKNVTNKRMKTSFDRPQILLLTCSVELERSENKLSSFDQLRSQEYEYLKNLVARIYTHKPDIILVQGSVAKTAQDMLFDLGITLVINVKASVMKRVSRLTQGDLLMSVDQLMFPMQLGTCGQFYLKNFYLPQGGKKTLMCFDQCVEHLGCCVLLQGAGTRELRKVKAVFRFAVSAAYNACLETEYLCSSFAALPPLVAAAEDSKYKCLQCVLSHSPDPTLYPCVTWPTAAPSAPDFNTGVADTPDIHRCAATIEESIEEGYKCQSSTATGQSENTITDPELAQEYLPTFADALNGQILSVSPYIRFDIPYLMSTAASGYIRQYIPPKLYWSHLFKPSAVAAENDDVTDMYNDNYIAYTPSEEERLITSVNPWEKPSMADECQETPGYISAAIHPFTTCSLLFARDSKEMQTILADYRARAGQPNSKKFFFKLAQTSSILDNQLFHMAGATESSIKKIKLETHYKVIITLYCVCEWKLERVKFNTK